MRHLLVKMLVLSMHSISKTGYALVLLKPMRGGSSYVASRGVAWRGVARRFTWRLAARERGAPRPGGSPEDSIVFDVEGAWPWFLRFKLKTERFEPPDPRRTLSCTARSAAGFIVFHGDTSSGRS